MKQALPFIFYYILTLTIASSCTGQQEPDFSIIKDAKPAEQSIPLLPDNAPIANYIRNIYQDKNGHIWMGTNGYGVARYNGGTLDYFSTEQGFQGQQITGISEDLHGNLWFSTNLGIVKFNTSTTEITNFNLPPFFQPQQFWSILADTKGNVWAGSTIGIYKYSNAKWSEFSLTYPEKSEGKFITTSTTWGMTEDRAGNIWFSTNGYGVFKFDGENFSQLTKEDGLTDNSVDHILEDREGNMWFGTRHGGISKYDGKEFKNFTSQDSIGNDEVCVVYEDKKGNIWFSSEGYGVYRYDGTSFKNYSTDEGLEVRAPQAIYEDREGRFWVGGGGGLYKLEGDRFIEVRKAGPWR